VSLRFLHVWVKPHPTLTSAATSGAILNTILFWSSSSNILPANQIWLLVVQSFQETFQSQLFHMWWRSSSCYGKMVLRTAWRFLQRQVRNTFVSTGSIVLNKHGEMKYVNKVHIPSYTLFFVSFWYLVWV
jgi:hypothetical protein